MKVESQPPAAFAAHPTAEGHLALTGEFDLIAVDDFKAALASAHEIAGYRVVLDLSGLDFIDSSGLHAIVEAVIDAKSRAWTLTISSDMPEQVHRSFEIAGLLHVLPFVEID